MEVGNFSVHYVDELGWFVFYKGERFLPFGYRCEWEAISALASVGYRAAAMELERLHESVC